MNDWIRVPRNEWLKMVLQKHLPVTVDIGDQRDPYDIVVCSCETAQDRYNTAKNLGYTENNKLYYPMHLYEILEKDYYNRLDLQSMHGIRTE